MNNNGKRVIYIDLVDDEEPPEYIETLNELRKKPKIRKETYTHCIKCQGELLAGTIGYACFACSLEINENNINVNYCDTCDNHFISEVQNDKCIDCVLKTELGF